MMVRACSSIGPIDHADRVLWCHDEQRARNRMIIQFSQWSHNEQRIIHNRWRQPPDGRCHRLLITSYSVFLTMWHDNYENWVYHLFWCAVGVWCDVHLACIFRKELGKLQLFDLFSRSFCVSDYGQKWAMNDDDVHSFELVLVKVNKLDTWDIYIISFLLLIVFAKQMHACLHTNIKIKT